MDYFTALYLLRCLQAYKLTYNKLTLVLGRKGLKGAYRLLLISIHSLSVWITLFKRHSLPVYPYTKACELATIDPLSSVRKGANYMFGFGFSRKDRKNIKTC